ncbi:hypothetical protein GCM10023259_084300 [Thermocatellispora tengchongensis]
MSTHWIVATEAPKSRAKAPTATLTIVPSSIVMISPSSTTSAVLPSAGSAPVALRAVVVIEPGPPVRCIASPYTVALTPYGVAVELDCGP